MKKNITKFLCGLMLLSTFVGCGSSEKWELVEIPGYTLGNEDTSTLAEATTTKVRFHYSRNDTQYPNWSLWCWDKAGTSGRFEFTHYDEFGVWGDVELSQLQGENPTTELGFLIAIDPGGTWQAKDYESDRFVSIQPTTPGGIQHVYLLSGGEKAFTAIALLFAILKINPAPFCVLDEIEAALDDVNVYRFAEYLKKFSKDTQFLVITHRKGTMEAADTVYGVTMEENGISKLLSMKLK